MQVEAELTRHREVATRAGRRSLTQRLVPQLITGAIVVGPVLALCVVTAAVFEQGVPLTDLGLAVVLYLLVGHGVTIGFHRLFAHRSFEASRPLKIALAVAGSMAFEGGVIGWVAAHRRHHAFADRPGDPHSPDPGGLREHAAFGGLWHAHIGWLFANDPTSISEYAPDLLADRDLRVIDRLFPVWCVVSLAVPFGLGWVIGGTLTAGLGTLLWAGAVRIGVLHHVTWATNSVCHAFGKRPFRTRDRSTNVAVLGLVSMGESWHNAHHAFPALARHGIDPHQTDSSARIIHLFERLGWASGVHWPDQTRLDARRAATSA